MTTIKDGMQLLKEFMGAQAWESALQTVTSLLADSEIAAGERAFCYYAQCRALSNLNRYGAALEPGQRAIFLAIDLQDYDLLGLSLIEVAWAQRKLQMHTEAAESLKRYLVHLHHYSEDVQRHHADALLNLGTTFRALGDREQAMLHFSQAWEQGRKAAALSSDETQARKVKAKAEHARSLAVWESLELPRLEVAERLIPHGDQYLQQYPRNVQAKVMHLLDLAQYAFVKGNTPTAAARALEAASSAEKYPDLMANAFLIMYNVALASEQYEDAFTAALVALKVAERAELYDLVAEVQEKLECLYLKCPKVVHNAVGETLKPKDAGKSGRGKP